MSSIVFSGKGQPQKHCPRDEGRSAHQKRTRHDLDAPGQQEMQVTNRNGFRPIRSVRMVLRIHHPTIAVPV